MCEEKKYNVREIKAFFKKSKGHKYELFYKLIFSYRMSRYEILNLKWDDIDFDNNTITIYPIRYLPNDRSKNYWDMNRVEELAITYPLLDHLRTLLKEEKKKQVKYLMEDDNYLKENIDFLCVDNKGKRLNANTLSRNLKYIARDNKLPEILISGIKTSADDFFLKNCRSFDYYRCWTRFDILDKRENIYKNYSLLKNNYFIKMLNNLIDQNQSSHTSNFEM